MTSPDTDNTKSKGKRKKESVVGFYVSASEFSDSRIIQLIRNHGLQGYTIYSCARCLIRAVAELRLSCSDASSNVAWILHCEQKIAQIVLDDCAYFGLLQSDHDHIWSDEINEDVARFDKRRQQLIDAGSKGGKAKAELQATLKQPDKLTKVRKGKVRRGKESVKELDPNYPPALVDWIEYRRDDLKKPLTPRAIKALLKTYEGKPGDLTRDVQHSMSQGYQGLFSPSGSSKPTAPPPDQSGFDLIKRLADEERRASGISD